MTATNSAPFNVQPRLTQIAMAVKPEGMIADEVCPRIPVPAELFVYSKFDHLDAFQIPDTHVGRSSEPTNVEFGSTDIEARTEDHGLDDFVPNKDILAAQAAGANFDPMATATEMTATLVSLAREQRVANLLFGLNTYNASLRTTLSGNSQWSDPTNSDPLDAIMTALDDMLIRPNSAVFGQKVWSKLRRHPKLVAAAMSRGGVAATTAAAGVLDKQAVADLLELKNIFIGKPFANTAKKGQTASMARLWGNHAAFIQLDPNIRSAQGMAMPTFCFTAEFGSRFVVPIHDQKKGLKGGVTVRVGEQVKELVCFQEAGYFFQNAVA